MQDLNLQRWVKPKDWLNAVFGCGFVPGYLGSGRYPIAKRLTAEKQILYNLKPRDMSNHYEDATKCFNGILCWKGIHI